MDVDNTGLHVESTGVGIETPWVQGTLHEGNKNEGGDYDTSKIVYKDIPEDDLHHHQLTSPTERHIYKLRQRKPS